MPRTKQHKLHHLSGRDDALSDSDTARLLTHGPTPCPESASHATSWARKLAAALESPAVRRYKAIMAQTPRAEPEEDARPRSVQTLELDHGVRYLPIAGRTFAGRGYVTAGVRPV